MFDKAFDWFATEGKIVKRAPRLFIIGVFLCTAVLSIGIYWFVDHLYSSEMRGKDAEIELLKLVPKPPQETIDALSGTVNQPGLPIQTAHPFYHGICRVKLKFNGSTGFTNMGNGNVGRCLITPLMSDDSTKPTGYVIVCIYSNELQPLQSVDEVSMMFNGKEIIDQSKVTRQHTMRWAVFEIHQEIPVGAILELAVKPIATP